MPETPNPGETWRHKQDGWSAVVAYISYHEDYEAEVILKAKAHGARHFLHVPLDTFLERFERLEPPMTEPRPGEIWRSKSNSLLLVEVLEVRGGRLPTVYMWVGEWVDPLRPMGYRREVNLPWFLENFETPRTPRRPRSGRGHFAV